MQGNFVYRWPRPSFTADTVLLRRDAEDGDEILLVRRARDPFALKWALPGGFMEMDETAENCARRELSEETGLALANIPFRFVGLYDDPARDPRGRTLSAAFLAVISSEKGTPKAGDDAADARFWPITTLPPLAFDHEKIVRDAMRLAGIEVPK